MNTDQSQGGQPERAIDPTIDPTIDPAIDPATALRIIQEQTSVSADRLGYSERAALLAWGAAYLIGYLLLALAIGPEAPGVVSAPVAYAGFAVCICLGAAVSIVLGVRLGRGMRGVSARRGMRYGHAWWFGFLPVFAFSRALERTGLDSATAGVLVNSVAIAVVACLLLGGGVVWDDPVQYVVGGVMAVGDAVALAVGLPAYYWIMCFGIGGLLLLAGVLYRPLRRLSRDRRPGNGRAGDGRAGDGRAARERSGA